MALGISLALTATALGCDQRPKAVAVALPTPAGASTESTCRTFIAALPAELDAGVHRIPTHPYSPLVAAWGSTRAPIVVRCGVPIPKDYDPAAQLTAVNIDATGEVAWYPSSAGSVTVLTTVRRPVKVELRLPRRYRPDVILGSVTKVVATTTPKGSDGAS